MSDNAITSGEWHASQIDPDGDDVFRWSIWSSGNDGDWLVAVVENGAPGDSIETEAANAKAIAAVPKMLAFVREVSYGPYRDSDKESLLETLRARSRAILNEIEMKGGVK